MLRTRIAVLRVFRFLYLLVLIFFLLWSIKDYASASRGYRGLWSGEPGLDPLSASPSSPLVVLECGFRDSLLIVRLLRTYAEPEAEDLQVVVVFETVDGESVVMEVRRKIVPGGIISVEFPLGFSADRMVGYRVEVYLNGKLTAAKQGS